MCGAPGSRHGKSSVLLLLQGFTGSTGAAGRMAAGFSFLFSGVGVFNLTSKCPVVLPDTRAEEAVSQCCDDALSLSERRGRWRTRERASVVTPRSGARFLLTRLAQGVTRFSVCLKGFFFFLQRQEENKLTQAEKLYSKKLNYSIQYCLRTLISV